MQYVAEPAPLTLPVTYPQFRPSYTHTRRQRLPTPTRNDYPTRCLRWVASMGYPLHEWNGYNGYITPANRARRRLVTYERFREPEGPPPPPEIHTPVTPDAIARFRHRRGPVTERNPQLSLEDEEFWAARWEFYHPHIT
jgi:hypothetical protein